MARETQTQTRYHIHTYVPSDSKICTLNALIYRIFLKNMTPYSPGNYSIISLAFISLFRRPNFEFVVTHKWHEATWRLLVIFRILIVTRALTELARKFCTTFHR